MPSKSNPDTDIIRRPAAGKLFVVGTPIGNPKDITLRGLEVLREVDFIACEDTRETGRLLKWHHIENRLTSFHEHNEQRKTPQLIKKLNKGAVAALVSDAGSPLISDPGYRLVQAAVADGLAVIPIPGPCAPISALSVSGLPTDAFTFFGFPPKKKGKLEKFIDQLAAASNTIVLFESPRRICDLLSCFLRIAGDRNCMVAREMTKRHEECIRGTVSQVLQALQKRSEIKGEITLVIAGASQSADIEQSQMLEEIRRAMAAGDHSVSEIARTLSARLGVSKKTVYQAALEIQNNIETARGGPGND